MDMLLEGGSVVFAETDKPRLRLLKNDRLVLNRILAECRVIKVEFHTTDASQDLRELTIHIAEKE